MKQHFSSDITLSPIDMNGARKTELRTQFAALPFRVRKGKIEIMLITSRRTKRWILPKGWPHDGLTPAQSAAQEAYEEAGLEGKVYDVCLGVYTYTKTTLAEELYPCIAMVYPLKVKKVNDTFREVGQRKRKWLSPAKAAKRVIEPDLAHIIKSFQPKITT